MTNELKSESKGLLHAGTIKKQRHKQRQLGSESNGRIQGTTHESPKERRYRCLGRVEGRKEIQGQKAHGKKKELIRDQGKKKGHPFLSVLVLCFFVTGLAHRAASAVLSLMMARVPVQQFDKRRWRCGSLL